MSERYAPPDVSACIFWLKNRRRIYRKQSEEITDHLIWRDKVEQEISGPDGGPIETNDRSAVELARKLAFLLNQGTKEKS